MLLQPLANNIWLAEGETVRFYGMPYSTRMVVVRLANGELWLHSPIGWSPALAEELAQLGPVAYLLAPNALHHLYLAQWQQQWPEAALYATSGVQKKRPELHYQGCLSEPQHWPWQAEIAQQAIKSSKVMEEVVFFHRPSATLIVTDLIENFAPEHFRCWQRPIARLCGILTPGSTPLDWRLSFSKSQAAEEFAQLHAWQPQRIIPAHGEWIDQDAPAFLRRALAWAPLSAGGHRAKPRDS